MFGSDVEPLVLFSHYKGIRMKGSGITSSLHAVYSLSPGKPKAKKFYYSSDIVAGIVEQGLADEAALNETTVSQSIEECLVRSVVTDVPSLVPYMTRILASRASLPQVTDTYGVRDALEDIFREEAAGADFNSRHGLENRPLVEFARNYIRSKYSQRDTARIAEGKTYGDPLPHMLRCLDAMRDQLKRAIEDVGSVSMEGFDLEYAIKFAGDIRIALENDPCYLYFNAITFVLKNWSVFGDSTYAYSFLADLLSAASNCNDTPYDRIMFRRVCEEVMSNWPENIDAR